MQSLELALRSSQKSDHKVLILGRSLSPLEFLFLTYYLSKTNENPEERNPYLWRIINLIPLLFHLLLLLLLLVVFRDIKFYFLKKWNLFLQQQRNTFLAQFLGSDVFFRKKKHPDAYVYLWKTQASGTSPW